MFTHTSVHLNFSWPKIKSTHVNLKYIISIHSKSIRTQNFFSSKEEEVAHWGNTQMATDNTHGSQTHSNTLTRQHWAWMTNRFSDLDIPELTHTAHIQMYVSMSWLLSFSLLFFTKNILALTYKHTPLYIAKFMDITTFIFIICPVVIK